MKNETNIAALWMSLFCMSVVTASGESTCDVSRLEPQYMAQTNGSVAVCAMDHRRGVLLKLKGIEMLRSQLPETGNYTMYELGERPSVSPDAWKVPKEYHYHYGKIPFPVEDADPLLSSYWNTKGDLLVGVRLGWRFYAMKNLGQIQKNAAFTNAIMIQHPLKIIEVKIPRHRIQDIDVFSKKEKAKYSSAEREEQHQSVMFCEQTNGAFAVYEFATNDIRRQTQ